MDSSTEVKENRKKTGARRKGPLIAFVIGVVALVAGVVCLCVNLFQGSAVQDAEYLIQIGEWQREDEPTVVWVFSEVGSGALTTDNHGNDYPFIWAMEGDKLKVETEWLYGFDNEYTYQLDQGAQTLTLSDDTGVWTFVPVGEDEE